ncbi:MAG TPA: carboxylating nicotinate-nucleotide diphosphorylase [Streptosporangiaceae bacterium]|nr:carboxylating nicotinate-nucleotide diphosphorylase [Streptosporangiaceae bacterium]
MTTELAAAGLDPADVERVVTAALDEDLRYGEDVTTVATVPAGMVAVAEVVARQPGVLAGGPVAVAVLDAAGLPAGCATVLRPDGSAVAAGEAVLSIKAPLRGLLTAERTLLNLMTRLSGIATATRAWVDAIDGTGAVVRDTRKTTPGLRLLEKYAVRCGGGANHRLGLGDAALIKDNHVAAAGGITLAIDAVRAAIAARCADGAPMLDAEVECDTLDQVKAALAAGCDLILLDNMGLADLRAAVALARDWPGVQLEASGGLTLPAARDVALTGVDYLSVGGLTHSSPALDLGLDLRAG